VLFDRCQGLLGHGYLLRDNQFYPISRFRCDCPGRGTYSKRNKPEAGFPGTLLNRMLTQPVTNQSQRVSNE